MLITFLDMNTLGDDLDFSVFKKYGEVRTFESTSPAEVSDHIAGADILIVNKVVLKAENLAAAKNLKLICEFATGYDNIDIGYCKAHSIAVCNIKGYAAATVSQLTVAMALSLIMHLREYDTYVKDGSYTKSGVHNYLKPVFHEMASLTWGIAGMGAIGSRTAAVAEALGANVISFSRSEKSGYRNVSLEELCRESDILSIHLPFTEKTVRIFDREHISLMKSSAVLINVARGAVIDERALCDAVKGGMIGGFATDVYFGEPMSADSPFNELLAYDNCIFTPHMAWGAYEARVRCIEEIKKNIDSFLSGEIRNRVEI